MQYSADFLNAQRFRLELRFQIIGLRKQRVAQSFNAPSLHRIVAYFR